MGKTHRNVYAGSNSVDYHSPQSRGFAKEKKANSHRKIRAHNKSANEDNIKSVNDLYKTEIMNNHWASGYRDEVGNIPNNPESYNLVILDHFYLVTKERGFNTKETIDKLSQYQVECKNLFNYSFINLQQFNQGLSSVERMKFKGADISPAQGDFRDSTNPYSDSDCVIGLMSPFKMDMEECLGYNIKRLKRNFLMFKIIK